MVPKLVFVVWRFILVGMLVLIETFLVAVRGRVGDMEQGLHMLSRRHVPVEVGVRFEVQGAI
jgi:hypothetical protein